MVSIRTEHTLRVPLRFRPALLVSRITTVEEYARSTMPPGVVTLATFAQVAGAAGARLNSAVQSGAGVRGLALGVQILVQDGRCAQAISTATGRTNAVLVARLGILKQ